MAEITLVIGATARGSDGFPGEVKYLVVDPGERAVTHLVVEPGAAGEARSGLARLVPLDHVDATGEEIVLRYTEAEFEAGYEAPLQLLPGGEGWRSAGGPVADGSAIPQIREMETVPVAPETEAGTTEVDEGRGDRVHATDGDIGRLLALQVDSADGRVTQVLLAAGHLLGRKLVTVPAGHVSGFDGGIRLDLTKQQVRDLPAPD